MLVISPVGPGAGGDLLPYQPPRRPFQPEPLSALASTAVPSVPTVAHPAPRLTNPCAAAIASNDRLVGWSRTLCGCDSVSLRVSSGHSPWRVHRSRGAPRTSGIVSGCLSAICHSGIQLSQSSTFGGSLGPAARV